MTTIIIESEVGDGIKGKVLGLEPEFFLPS